MSDFTVKNGVLTDYHGDSKHIVIPDDVTAIADQAFMFNQVLVSITIPVSVTSIGYHAFDGCKSLEEVTILGNLTHLGEGIFSECWKLRNVVFAGSINEEGDDDDGLDCDFFDDAENEPNQSPSLFESCVNLTDITLPKGINSLGKSMFLGCSRLKVITIPESVTHIGDNCFDSCTSLTQVDFRNPATSIGSYAFVGCSALENITLPSACPSVGNFIFNGCTNLKKVTVPTEWTTVPALMKDAAAYLAVLPDPNLACEPDDKAMPNAKREYAMHYLSHIEKYNAGCIKKRMKYILHQTEMLFEMAVERNNIQAIHELLKLGKADLSIIERLLAVSVKKQMTEVVAMLMDYKNKLAEQTAEDTMPTLDGDGDISTAEAKKAWKFSNDKALSGIKLTAYLGTEAHVIVPESIDSVPIVSIGAKVFAKQENLQSVIFPASIKELPAATFRDCKNLVSVVLPEQLTAIGKQIFWGCTSLEHIHIPISITHIETNAFFGCESLKQAIIPASVTHINPTAFSGCTSISQFEIAEDNPAYCAINGILFSKDGKEVVIIPSQLEPIRIPDGVKRLKSHYCGTSTRDQHIYIPASVKMIDWGFVGINPEGCRGDITIHGAKGSMAEEYANSCGYKFEEE